MYIQTKAVALNIHFSLLLFNEPRNSNFIQFLVEGTTSGTGTKKENKGKHKKIKTT